VIAGARLVGFVASTDLDRSERFYVGTLGLPLLDRSPFAVVVDGGGTQLRITAVPAKADALHTVCGWEVTDIDAAVDDLRGRGIEFLRFDGMEQDDRGIWRAPSGARVAWFADPDGNTLSLQG
jgi:catechol 2,3-dioxygenase-like lactoylglutathione lyase family enzyme